MFSGFPWTPSFKHIRRFISSHLKEKTDSQQRAQNDPGKNTIYGFQQFCHFASKTLKPEWWRIQEEVIREWDIFPQEGLPHVTGGRQQRKQTLSGSAEMTPGSQNSVHVIMYQLEEEQRD